MSASTAAATKSGSGTPATTGKIPKPEMRNLFFNKSKWALVGATVTSLAAVLIWKVAVVDVKKQKYAEFYKAYDPVAEEKRLLAAGVYKWAPGQ